MLGANTESKLGPHHDDLRQVMSPVKHRDVGRLTSSVRSHYHHHPLHDKSQVIRLITMPTAIGVFFNISRFIPNGNLYFCEMRLILNVYKLSLEESRKLKQKTISLEFVYKGETNSRFEFYNFR